MSRNRSDEPDTALAAAFKRADERKHGTKEDQAEARRKKRLERIEALRAKTSEGSAGKPAPQRPAWDESQAEPTAPQIEAIALKLGAPGSPERREHMRRIGQIGRDRTRSAYTPEELSERMRRIARGESPAVPMPERPQEPKATPPAPDDPRLLNGTLAPSERVAGHISRAAVAAAPTQPAAERPLQDSPHPAGWLDILENGTPIGILAGREFKQLNEDEKAAYHRARGRVMQAKMAETGTNPAKAPRTPRIAFANMSAFGRKITSLRLERNWTMQDVADATGIPAGSLSKFLKAHSSEVPDDRLQLLASAFGIEVSEFIADHNVKPVSLSRMEPHERLLYLMKRANYGIVALSKASGLSTSTINNALREVRPLTAKSAKRLAPLLKTFAATLTSPSINSPEPNMEAAAPVPQIEAPSTTTGGWSNLAHNVTYISRRLGLRDVDVAEKAGLWKTIVRDLRRDPKKMPKHGTLTKLATALQTTVEVLVGPPVASADAAPDMAAAGTALVANAEAHRGEVVEADAMTFTPRVDIERNAPPPSGFRLSEAMYRFDELGKGDAIRADVPHGMTFEVFRNRFSVMVANAQHKTGHWYHTEASEDRTYIRLWRMI